MESAAGVPARILQGGVSAEQVLTKLTFLSDKLTFLSYKLPFLSIKADVYTPHELVNPISEARAQLLEDPFLRSRACA